MNAGTEIEFKLDVPTRIASRVHAHAALRSRRRIVRTHLLSVYYDTPKFDLWHAQASVRLRRTPAGWIQTAKWAGSAHGGLHRRNEVEHAVAEQALDLSVLVGQPGLEVLADERVRRRLKPIFVTEFERALRLVTTADGASIEASLDRGRIVCGTAVRPICELELELKAGPPLALFDVADALIEDLPLRPAHLSKAERGYRLAGLAQGAAKAKRVMLAPDWDIGRGISTLVASGLEQMQVNAEGMLLAEDIEYLHQMRVGVRRLRTSLNGLDRILPDGVLDRLAGELKWLGASLGAARDWDVFREEAWPPVARALGATEQASAAEALAESAKVLGESAGRRARAAWSSKRASQLLVTLGRTSAGGGFVAAHRELQAPILPYASALLARRLARVARRGKKLGRAATVAELHALRIAVKKLRYVVECFASLYPPGNCGKFRDRLVELQDSLGRICDADSMVERVRRAAPDSPALIEFARGWSACVLHAERRRFDALWREFRRSRAFW